MLKFLLYLVSSILPTAFAGDQWVFFYDNMGRDWGTDAIPPDDFTGKNHCGDPENQAPINLMAPLGSYGWAYGTPIPVETDQLEKHYENPGKGSRVVWQKKNLMVKIPSDDDSPSYYNSQLLQKLHKAPSSKSKPVSFHFHVPTEHAFNGKRHDMELHVNHQWLTDDNPTQVIESLVSVKFSVEDFSPGVSDEEKATIGSFLDSLNLNSRAGDELQGFELDQMFFKEAMNIFDFDHRYQYLGSKMKPPCEKYVIWTVLEKVYPIDFKYVYYLRQRFLEHEEELGAQSNIRATNHIDGHHVYYIGSKALALSSLVSTVVLIIIM